jgi:muconolactone delta-isomerase
LQECGSWRRLWRLIDGFEAQAVITRKAYDCNALRQIIADR